MKKRILAALLSAALLLCIFSGCKDNSAGNSSNDNNQSLSSLSAAAQATSESFDKYSTYYQLLVYSFADSNGDGIGDLKGISEKLDYLSELGIGCLWLSPIHPSTSYYGYDVIDYYAVNPDFIVDGYTLTDLIEDCREYDISIILDLVINHTSTECQWFKEGYESFKNGGTSKYQRYYNFSNSADGVENPKSIDGIYYEAYFGGHMPDLNYDNFEVVNEIINVGKYWMDQGVAGFRIDAAKHIYNDAHADSINILRYFYDGIVKEYPYAYVVGEVWDSTQQIQYYASNFDSNLCFDTNSKIVSALSENGGYAEWLESYQDSIRAIQPDGIEAYFISNHDSGVGRFADGRDENQLKMAAALQILAPGAAFIYYGDEIAMLGSRTMTLPSYDSWYMDVNYRTPMYWDTDSELSSPYIANSLSDYIVDCFTLPTEGGSVAEQDTNSSSLLNYYRDVIAIKNSHPVLASGDIDAVYSSSKSVIVYTVEQGDEMYAVIHNVSSGEATVTLSGADFTLADSDWVSVHGDKVTASGNTVTLPSYSSAVLSASKAASVTAKVDCDALPASATQFYLMGGFNNWQENSSYLFTSEGNNTYVFNMTFNSSTEIKVYGSGNWYGGESVVNTDESIYTVSGDYGNIMVAPGTYNIYYYSDTCTVSIQPAE